MPNILASLNEFQGYVNLVNLLTAREANESYIVGGGLRSILLDRPIKDLDFFAPRFVLSRLIGSEMLTKEKGQIKTGPLGSPRWIVDDAFYFDLVAIEDVNHGFGPCHGIRDALSRFDFTANAIGYCIGDERTFDPVGGLNDISTRTMRAVRFDAPDVSIRPDSPITWRASQWIRIMHYRRRLAFRIEPATERWLNENSDCGDYVPEFARLFFSPEL